VPDTGNISEFYSRESAITALERILNRIYGEVYTEILPRHCLHDGKELPIREGSAFVIMDAMSLREASLFSRTLREEGFKVELGYSFSATPSETIFYKEKIDYTDLMRKFPNGEVVDRRKINLKGNEKIVWSRFPDAYVESIKAGKTKLSSIERMYQDSQQILLEVIKKLDADQIVVGSDHGYVRFEPGYSFLTSDQAKRSLRNNFVGSRYLSMEEKDLDALVEKELAVAFNGFYMVRGRYVWPMGGKYKVFVHGGISLMECLTPRLCITR
jgi:hypothetical protein